MRDDVHAALHAWRDSLVDLGDTNRLINFPPDHPDLVEVVGPEPEAVLAALRLQDDCGLAGTGADPERLAADGVVLRSEMPEAQLDATVRRMARKARQEYLDRGVSVLHLVFGLLRWRDESGDQFASPVLLVPVDLVTPGPGDPPRLRLRDDDAVFNPALAIRLRGLGVEPPVVRQEADLDLEGLWSALQSQVSRRRGWHVERGVLLCGLTFHKEAIYRDLLVNEDRIVAHPVVRALASTGGGEPGGDFRFAAIQPGDIDRLAPPEHIPLVLDADASQRACVAAAVAGHSFVMDGPPGTGKSQTIANMIGCLLHAGKRVLFVSEKAAALDVVHHRLVEAGLHRHVLELHGHKAGRKEVATALAAALDESHPPARQPDSLDRRAPRELREQLSAYAYAMNEVRKPLARSLHDVLGICSRLSGAPAAPVPVIPPASVTPESLRRIREAADRLSTAWRAVAGRESLPWRDVLRREPLDPVLSRAERALAGLARALPATAPFGLAGPGDAAVLARLAGHAGKRPAAARDEWVTAADLTPMRRAAQTLGRDLTAVRAARDAAGKRAGTTWSALPVPADLPSVPNLSGLTPAPVDLNRLTAAEADRQARECTEAADALEKHRGAVDRVTAKLGLPNAVAVADIGRIAALAELGARRNRPEPFWFGPGTAATVATGAQVLRRSLENLVAAEVRARPFFAEAILTQPVDELADRFARVHRGWRRMLGGYRRDKRVVATFVLPTASVRDALPRLETAVAWQRARLDLAAAEQAYGSVLGRYWQGPGTDFAAVSEALQVVDAGLRMAPVASIGAVAAYLCSPRPDSDLIRLATTARDAVLGSRPGPPELLTGSIDTAVEWLRAHGTALAAVATVVRAYDAATGHHLDFAEVSHLGRLRQEVARAETAMDERAADYATVFGEAFQGADTDEKALAAALDWTATARRLLTGQEQPLSDAHAGELRDLRPIAGLNRLAEQWTAAREAVLEAFAPARRPDLESRLGDHERARGFLEEIRADAGGQEEWFAAQDARAVLSGYGLDGVIEFCADRAVPADQVRPAVERAFFRSWADAVIQSDQRLRPWRASDRDRLAADFATRDLRLGSAASADIERAVVSRRPAADSPGAELIRREAMKASRHLPVRELIGQARELVLGLRPCFLMSPLTVSQSLPPDIRFDVVIFDEASQVTPADAINCVYRGAALITAGDERQLPPTSFFDRAAGTPDEPGTELPVLDFQSVLELAKGCGAFTSLGLNWHYRSRHEALIAFSNREFYQDRLSVFPSATPAGADTGVALIPAEGVYRRSGARDNPVEAHRVAERILHHFSTRPGLSLGVVTFSVAQAEAIDKALAAMAPGRLFDDDRLHGFFVKSLETVQGDERDVMIFSIGYGYDETGKISANFGALNRPNGWRRLNVAITRARYRVEIVTSISARDVPVTENEGVRLLAGYLEYAEHGAIPAETTAGPGGPFAESVLATVRSWGYPAVPALGSAGGRVDIGVRTPGIADAGFALGIRCDGPAYAGCSAARDRDRLSGQVLADLGWKLHRIWSVAWYRDRDREEERLRSALELAAGTPRMVLSDRAPVRALELPARTG
ncbi:DUF4011 domain-containing protein [Actinoplanes derwentensis]|uniref:Part of AAA domain-containing protein n=1 Tax=Actinoplanes derwentensis TaxID=113562 RepID=A0A1H1UX63_9ACTN|nr:DUF4011 domain-containing protein [Actinoplanes derwentensis]GID88897.1 hypothetical protein Ade03nite_78210 [Actinoplanes derwentensis]SDS76851.1 Part of AAA domain-containing protein [Actinoplanes derwentensis]